MPGQLPLPARDDGHPQAPPAVVPRECTDELAQISRVTDDLETLEARLAREVAERKALESELVEVKTDLADVREALSEAEQKEEAARREGLRDPLTGLPNRALLEEALDQALGQSRRHAWKLALLFVDVDDFKRFNDGHGHHLGDQILVTVAARLSEFVRAEDVVSRWGGDEFVCMILEIRSRLDAERLADRMAERLAEPCTIDGVEHTVRVSIGIALAPTDGATSTALLHHADTAMYRAKRTEPRIARHPQASPPDETGVRIEAV